MITYPVEPNSRWSLYSISEAKVVKHNARWPRSDGMEIVGLDPDLVPLREVTDVRPVPEFDPENPTAPVFDPATHKVETGSAVVDVDENTHTHGWNIVALTQEELDAIAARASHDSTRDLAKTNYVDLRDSTGTQLERLQRVERVAAYLLKDKFFNDLSD